MYIYEIYNYRKLLMFLLEFHLHLCTIKIYQNIKQVKKNHKKRGKFSFSW